MKHLIVGTAGHIDHGKSALVRALTDIDPDRLKEEKERGLTIDLGFAYFDLPDGARVGFVDVPGHERFVKNMLAGAAGMDIVILVIDATESVMPQTREHLDIMKLLGVSHGMIAITKIDLADEEMIEIVEAEIEELVEGTFLKGAPLVKVSSKTGDGLEEVRELIGKAVDEKQQKKESGLFRFPIDRVFTMKGFGTVVTGTVFSGWLGEDEPVDILPCSLSARARQLQSHNVKQDRILAGMRASLNLANLSVQQLARGDTLVRPGAAQPVSMFDAKVSLLTSAPRAIKRISTIKVYVATGQRLARMALVDNPKLEPGQECHAQIRLSEPMCVFRGDHFVIRGESPEFTVGGGLVLDVMPLRLRSKDQDRADWLQALESATPAEAANAFLSQKRTGARLTDVAVRTGEPADMIKTIIGRDLSSGNVVAANIADDKLIITSDNYEALKKRVIQELNTFFKSKSHRLFMPREELRNGLGADLAPQLFEQALDDLSRDKKIGLTREGVNLTGRKAEISEKQQATKEKMEKIFRDAGFSPPTFSQAEEQLGDPKSAKQMSSLLLEEGTLQKISPTLAYHKDHIEDALENIRAHFQTNDKLTVGDLKTLLDVSRKHAVPILEYTDKIGLTTRTGDHRVLKQTSQK